MDEKTLYALRASIAHWEENARMEDPTEAVISTEGCALCGLFCSTEMDIAWIEDQAEKANHRAEDPEYESKVHLYLKDEDKECDGCPVKAKVRTHGCIGTPWEGASIAYNHWKSDDPSTTVAWQEAAQAEVDFLKSLLPEGEAAHIKESET